MITVTVKSKVKILLRSKILMLKLYCAIKLQRRYFKNATPVA